VRRPRLLRVGACRRRAGCTRDSTFHRLERDGAAYNAGPNRIRSLRKEAADRHLDPNVWFDNVERVVSEHIGRETVQYVSNIYKYYIAYSLVQDDVARNLEQAEQTAH
jgi:membrane-bound lytic murein transglycosylase MltF